MLIFSNRTCITNRNPLGNYIYFNKQGVSEILISFRNGSARGVMVIVIENGDGDTSPNPGRD